jgi:ubiquinone/menaquinone biosynthesis C-methylase UbiE
MSVANTTQADPYDRLAPAYDVLSAGYDHERWLAALVELLDQCGLAGRTVLDVGCGTGASAAPLLAAGFAVTGVDRSEGMLDIARHRLGDEVELVRADMRGLPGLGAFAVVACLDDGLNHLLTGADLQAALESMARNLGPGGLMLFDLNTLPTLRSVFSGDWATERDGALVVWRGTGDAALAPGAVTQAEISVLRQADGGAYLRERLTVRERHHPLDEVLDRLWRAGLEPVAIRGQHRGGRLDEDTAEATHHKLVIVARRPAGLSAWAGVHGFEGGCC